MSTETVTLTVPGMEPVTSSLAGLEAAAAAAVGATRTSGAPPISVPQPQEFVDEGDEDVDFLPAADLERVANWLIERYERFAHLATLEARYLWKAEGGNTSGKRTLGKCQKPSGMLRHFSEADFVVWLAADHCRKLLLSQGQLVALVYHELRHAGMDDKGKPCVLPHDWAGFADEIVEHGLYLGDMRLIDQAMKQLRLPTADGRA